MYENAPVKMFMRWKQRTLVLSLFLKTSWSLIVAGQTLMQITSL